MKVPNQDRRLNRLIDDLKEKHHCHTIILYGSRARGDHTDISDYDIIAIRDEGQMERDCRVFEGAFLDAFIYSVADLEKADEFILRIKDGIVLCQKGDVGENILAHINGMIAKGPTPIPSWEKQVIITWHDKMFDRATKGDIEGNFRRVWQLYDLLESYFKLRDRWYLGPKEAFAWLNDNDKIIYDLFDNVLKNPTDLRIIRKLINQITLSEQIIDITVKNNSLSFDPSKIQLDSKINIRLMIHGDVPEIVTAFKNIGWNKPVALFQGYLEEQKNKERFVWCAYKNNNFAGYVTLNLNSRYLPFREQNIPEINDLNVLQQYRSKGIGTQLLDVAEKKAASFGNKVGIGVGLYPDYGAAQKLYVKRGYIPDGKGATYQYHNTLPGKDYCLDDDLNLWFIKEM
ncbi:MAG: GNAT family N-acetyltransferase [Candidatus Berkiellales bacterium]